MSFLNVEYIQYSDDDDIIQPTCKHCKLANKIEHHSPSGLYPEFLGKEGPVESHCPDLYDALDYLKLLWPYALTSLIVTVNNTYARWKKRTNWVDVSRELSCLLLEDGSKTRKAVHPKTSGTSTCYLKKVEEI